MYAHGHKRSLRAVARADQFEARTRGKKLPEVNRFEIVRQLYSEDAPLTWKNKQAFLGPVRLMKRSGELTEEGAFLETHGWVPPGRTRRLLGPVQA